jgi:ABC-2 type transport system ATP-binding protein
VDPHRDEQTKRRDTIQTVEEYDMSKGILADRLTKAYGDNKALIDLTFEVLPGCVYGMIGPNGAGKTTALSILAGLTRPTSGTATILGMNVRSQHRQLVGKLGFCSPQFGLFDYLKGREILLSCGLMHGLSAQAAESRVRDLLELLHLEVAADLFVYQYSQGMQQKLGVACALIHAPAVLLLDEPFAGLDSTAVYRLVHALRRVASNGGIVVMTSHDLAMVERVCDRVGILHEGRLKQEIEVSSRVDGVSGDSSEPQRPYAIESLLWEVVGKPEMKELAWL